MRSNKVTLILFISIICNIACQTTSEKKLFIEVVPKVEQSRVDVKVAGKYFTSYLFTDTLPVLKKPILYPIYSAGGQVITRAYPLNKKSGERVDHPHQVGCWLNYGNVNGLDFWNNSNAIPQDQLQEMGTIRHRSIDTFESGLNKATLGVSMDWLKPDGQSILEEKTLFVFSVSEEWRCIDRITTLYAPNEDVLYEDNKEGFFAIRLTRELEHPTTEPIILSDASGNATHVPVMDNTIVTGNYLNSRGVSGLDAWGKRAEWVSLSGVIDNDSLTVVIFDHPGNVGFPGYWHARGYGLFGINPLGQKIFSEGKEELNYSLSKGQKVTFKYRLMIINLPNPNNFIREKYSEFENLNY